MSFKFEFDQKAFERGIRKDVEDHVRGVSRDMTHEFDQLRAQFAGRPVNEIKPAVKRAWETGGGSITDPELTEYAQMISDGTEITFEAGPIQW